MAETNLAGLKAVEPKLQAFYDSLDAHAEEGVRHWRAHRRHVRLAPSHPVTLGIRPIPANFDARDWRRSEGERLARVSRGA
jgi:hypothetical protein